MIAVPCPAARDAALERLEAFLPRAGSAYASKRNFDFGPGDRSNVSVLSPFIRHRLILEEEVVAAVLRRHSFNTASKFIQEVCWRTYWKGWLEMRPQIWRTYLARLEALKGEMRGGSALLGSYDAAIEGRTGIEPFDAWVRELVETGYVHNHARMWFSSIWIFTLRLPWELGAEFFHRHLLDGDPASNTLSWRWVAGLHTAGKTYLARPDNIETYTAGRFRVRPGQLSRDAQAPGFDGHPAPQPLRKASNGAAMEEATLLVTEEDCQPETLPLHSSRIVSVLVLDPAAYNAGLADAVIDYKRAALADAARRAAAHFGCDAVPVTLDELSGRLAEPHTPPLVTAYSPVGPLRDAVSRIPALGLHEIRRDWDSAFWPHATHGFFKLREKIPSVLGRTVLRLA